MIIQQNIFICENCGKTETLSEQVDVFSDPVVVPPLTGGWGYGRFKSDDEALLCGDCKPKDPFQALV